MISVILVNWNRRELLRAALESLARQVDVDFEVIVVDNGSEDGSLEVIRTIGAFARRTTKGSPSPAGSLSPC